MKSSTNILLTRIPTHVVIRIVYSKIRDLLSNDLHFHLEFIYLKT